MGDARRTQARLNPGIAQQYFRRQQLTCPKVLVLDEIGYLPMNREEASLFFRILGRRYEKASLILTSNKSFLDWGEIFLGDQVLATTILDRLLHHATTLNITKEKTIT